MQDVATQTDNGSEFPNVLLEETLDTLEIMHNKIRATTSSNNGKIEHQHRTAEKRFYKKMRMYNLEYNRKQLAHHNKLFNTISNRVV
ncbi:MAG: hypothetical protein N2171_05175 [Clostridia bacterium]|nr:hypothetical protein [Clostridia bacterium]